MRTKITHRIGALAFAASLLLAGGPVPAADGQAADSPKAEARPFFPNFWDPKRRPDKPNVEFGAIRFATSGDFPPFDFLDSGGRLTGYNVDLAREICQELKVPCTIQMRPFDELVNALTERRADVVIAGLAATPALREKVELGEAYLTTPGRFVARKGVRLAATPEGLDGRWISVVSKSRHEAFVLENFPKARIAAYPTETAARDALRDGTVDMHFGDAMSLSFWLTGEASHSCCAYAGGPFLEQAYFGEGFRIGVAKGNRRLRRALDYALQRLAEDGTLGELYLRYFPLGYY